MSIFMQSHGGTLPAKAEPSAEPALARSASVAATATASANEGGTAVLERPEAALQAAPPAAADIAVDAVADFGYWFGPDAGLKYLPDDCIGELDKLGNLMIKDGPDDSDSTPDSTIAPIVTYWGQFLDHELTARTDRESAISDIATGVPGLPQAEIERLLKNARTPRFDLDSVYGGLPLGPNLIGEAGVRTVRLVEALRHPTQRAKMRVGTADPATDLPDTLDPHRDLPRFRQVGQATRADFLALAKLRLPAEEVAKLESTLPARAMIGDMRNDENLIVAQFHVSFLRFHNKAVDYLTAHQTGWPAEFTVAKALTKLHYQWLIERQYLPAVCDAAVVDRIKQNHAVHFTQFRADYAARQAPGLRGRALPLEFSVAAYRFGHTMVRGVYDYNRFFGRPGGEAGFALLFAFTGGGGFFGTGRLPQNWIADWTRMAGVDPNDGSDGGPARLARAIDTALAPPLSDLSNEAVEETQPDVKALFRHLARRNLRRGFNLRLPTGQSLHAKLKSVGAVEGDPIADISVAVASNPALADFLRTSAADFAHHTPLWFYLLAEAEQAGGNRLGELGSFIVASTFLGVLFDDPDSALSTGFEPSHSPLKMPGGEPVASIADWLRFAVVMA